MANDPRGRLPDSLQHFHLAEQAAETNVSVFVAQWRRELSHFDATGDSASTETRTFSAVRKTIAELSSLVRFIVNSLNVSNVLVTADHGFLYQNAPPGALKKSDLGTKPGGTGLHLVPPWPRIL